MVLYIIFLKSGWWDFSCMGFVRWYNWNLNIQTLERFFKSAYFSSRHKNGNDQYVDDHIRQMTKFKMDRKIKVGLCILSSRGSGNTGSVHGSEPDAGSMFGFHLPRNRIDQQNWTSSRVSVYVCWGQYRTPYRPNFTAAICFRDRLQSTPHRLMAYTLPWNCHRKEITTNKQIYMFRFP